MSRTRSRRTNFTAAQKVAIVREHLLEGVPISELCDRHGLKPNRFYLWQKQLFEQGTKAFESPRHSRERELDRKVAGSSGADAGDHDDRALLLRPEGHPGGEGRPRPPR